MATVVRKKRRTGKYYAVFKNAEGRQQWRVAFTDHDKSLNYARKLEDEAQRIRLGDIDPQAEARRVERAKPIESHITQYELSLKAAGRSANHIAYTVADVRKLLKFAPEIASASAITRPLIDRWVESLKSTPDPKRGQVDSNKTINRRIGSIQQFLGHLKTVGGVNEYVLFRYPKLPTGGNHVRRKVRALTRAERDALLADKSDRQTLYTFASKTGLRLKEIRQLAPAHIDFRHKVLALPAHITKAGRDQQIPLHPDLIPALDKLCEGRDESAHIFDVPSKQTIGRKLREDAKRLGIATKGLSFHSLRHTYCTLLAQANVHPALLQKLARHSDIKTTLRYYVHLQRSDEAQAIVNV